MTRYMYASVEGNKVFYREAGSKTAPTILLLHGFPTSSHMFRDLIPLLADAYHVVAPDLPGFGHSTMSANFEWKLPQVASVLAQFLDKMGVESAHIIGAKTGGAIAVQFAASYPQRTRTLVLATAPVSPIPIQTNRPPAPVDPLV